MSPSVFASSIRCSSLHAWTCFLSVACSPLPGRQREKDDWGASAKAIGRARTRIVLCHALVGTQSATMCRRRLEMLVLSLRASLHSSLRFQHCLSQLSISAFGHGHQMCFATSNGAATSFALQMKCFLHLLPSPCCCQIVLQRLQLLFLSLQCFLCACPLCSGPVYIFLCTLYPRL